MLTKISICIVAYNNYEDIKKTIDSMEKYTSDKLKKIIYIVDNSASVSDDTIANEFKKYITGFDDIVYIGNNENLGFGRGHNQVLNVIDSEYHAIVNPDILFCEDTLSKIVEWMDKNKEVGMSIPLIINEEGHRQEVYRKELTVFDVFNRMFLKGMFRERAKDHTLYHNDYSIPFQVPFGQGSFLVIRSELFKKLNGFDENFFMYVEDADLCKRVNQVSKLMYYPWTTVIHRWKMESHKNKALFKHHVESMIYYFRKWGWKIF